MANNKLRIIGGKWRSRILELPNVDAVRPTPNRVRETLFNWLAADIAGANCLDAFAGSGALGFEAASRGATSVTLVDSFPAVYKQLQISKDLLAADNVNIVKAEFMQHKFASETKFDIVFLDPPFNKALLIPCLKKLLSENLLANKALIYLEAEKSLEIKALPLSYEIIKQDSKGEVNYCLLKLVA